MNQSRPHWKSTPALISFILWNLSLQLSAAILLGQLLFGIGWFNPVVEGIAHCACFSLTFFHWYIGRHLIHSHIRVGDASTHSLQTHQAFLVVVMMIAGGAFGTALFLCR